MADPKTDSKPGLKGSPRNMPRSFGGEIWDVTFQGSRLVRDIEKRLDGYPKGYYLVINVDTGEYVVGPTITEAVDDFRLKYPDAKAYAHRIGEDFYFE